MKHRDVLSTGETCLLFGAVLCCCSYMSMVVVEASSDEKIKNNARIATVLLGIGGVATMILGGIYMLNKN